MVSVLSIVCMVYAFIRQSTTAAFLALRIVSPAPFPLNILGRYLLGGWNLQSVVAYVLVLALIPVFRPWRETVNWEYDALDYTTAGIVSPVC